MKKTLLLIPLLLAFLAHANGIPITADEFKAISLVGEGLIQAYPSDTHVIIGVGRSPTPIIAYLEIAHPGSAYHLPITNFRPAPGELERKGVLADFYAHLHQYFPDSATLRGRKIILLDYSQSGDTLISMQHYLGKYFGELKKQANIAPVAMATSADAPEVLANFAEHGLKDGKVVIIQDGLKTNPQEMFSWRIRHQKYESVARYTKALPHMKEHKVPILKNPEYDYFRLQLRDKYDAAAARCFQRAILDFKAKLQDL